MKEGANHSCGDDALPALPLQQLLDGRTGVLEDDLIVHQPFDILRAQGPETVDHAFPAFIPLQRTGAPPYRPARPRFVFVRKAAVPRLLIARQQAPAGQKRLHSTDPLDVQPEVLNQVLDMPYAVDVLQ